MSEETDRINEQKPQFQPNQHLAHANLNFSINDILNSDHDVNDSSLQSIVQTLSNSNDDITPSYAHLPAELQDLFNVNETEDLLSSQGDAADASIHDMASIWGRPDLYPQQPFMLSSSLSTSNLSSNNSTSQLSLPIQQQLPQTSQQIPLTPLQSAPSPLPTTPPQPISQNTPTTLLDNITAQLPPERREKFIELFKRLQTNSVTADQFLSQAKTLLGQQQYQQLEDLKNKSPQEKLEERKKAVSGSQLREEDTQRSMPGIM
ncbi:hypothetical protein BDB01DRAFT_805584 [Pilobolus umbonatus]|nr:hypothetical protein BDB01DRAFT_805584 [Pilobolus umbonatus]